MLVVMPDGGKAVTSYSLGVCTTLQGIRDVIVGYMMVRGCSSKFGRFRSYR